MTTYAAVLALWVVGLLGGPELTADVSVATVWRGPHGYPIACVFDSDGEAWCLDDKGAKWKSHGECD